MSIRLEIPNQLYKRMNALGAVRIRRNPRSAMRYPIPTHRLEHVNGASKRHNRIVELLRIRESRHLRRGNVERAQPLGTDVKWWLQVGWLCVHVIS
jgi:hypothetical protein